MHTIPRQSTEPPDAVYDFVSVLQRQIAGSMARSPRVAAQSIAAVATDIPRILSPLQTVVLRGILMDTFLRLSKNCPAVGAEQITERMRALATTEGANLRGTFVAACRSVAMDPDAWADDRSTVDGRVLRVLERLRTQPGRRHRLSELACEMRVSKWHLERLIRGATGRAFKTHARRVRMEHASIRLRKTDLSVKEVAVELGYGHLSDFSRDFRAIFGVSPRQWRSSL